MDREAECGSRGSQRWPIAGVDRRHGLDPHATDVESLAGRDLADVGEPGATQPAARPGRHDERQVPAEVAQGRHIEVIPVEVGEQHEIDAVEPVAMRHGLHPAQRPHPGARHGIGQDADPVQLDQDGRVADEFEGESPGQRQVLRAASG